MVIRRIALRLTAGLVATVLVALGWLVSASAQDTRGEQVPTYESKYSGQTP
jgi:hypothetical protein